MKKIAIFGDSFAANPHLETSVTTEGFLKKVYKVCNRPFSPNEVKLLRDKWGQKYIGWPRLLDADIYAQSGSDLYFSYNQFVNNHKNYDKCIFVVTSPFRYSTNTNGWIHTASYEDAIEKMSFAKDSADKRYFKSLSNFFKDVYYKDTDRVELLHNAIINSVKLIRPDTLFINAFPDLKKVYDLELAAWKTSHEESQDYKKYIDLRHCHMTNDNNEILSQFITDNVDTFGFLDLSTIQWQTPTLEEKPSYLPNTNNFINFLLS
jgi:hypothetical protein